MNMNDGIWIWFGLVMISGWFLPALVRWAGMLALLIIETAAKVRNSWDNEFPSPGK